MNIASHVEVIRYMKVIVIGASTKPYRTSYQAVHLLRSYDHDVIAIGKNKGQLAGVDIITYKPEAIDVDTVTLYINPSIQPLYYDYIIGLQPRRVIFNPGTENETFTKLLDEAEIPWEEACTLVLLRTGQFDLDNSIA